MACSCCSGREEGGSPPEAEPLEGETATAVQTDSDTEAISASSLIREEMIILPSDI